MPRTNWKWRKVEHCMKRGRDVTDRCVCVWPVRSYRTRGCVKKNMMIKMEASIQAKDVQPRVKAAGQVSWFRVFFVGVLIEQNNSRYIWSQEKPFLNQLKEISSWDAGVLRGPMSSMEEGTVIDFLMGRSPREEWMKHWVLSTLTLGKPSLHGDTAVSAISEIPRFQFVESKGVI